MDQINETGPRTAIILCAIPKLNDRDYKYWSEHFQKVYNISNYHIYTLDIQQHEHQNHFKHDLCLKWTGMKFDYVAVSLGALHHILPQALEIYFKLLCFLKKNGTLFVCPSFKCNCVCENGLKIQSRCPKYMDHIIICNSDKHHMISGMDICCESGIITQTKKDDEINFFNSPKIKNLKSIPFEILESSDFKELVDGIDDYEEQLIEYKWKLFEDKFPSDRFGDTTEIGMKHLKNKYEPYFDKIVDKVGPYSDPEQSIRHLKCIGFTD